MALPVWQEKMESAGDTSNTPVLVPLNKARKFFAVDKSGSTMYEILRAEIRLVKRLYGCVDDTVSFWDHTCEPPKSARNVDSDFPTKFGGTSPTEIIRQTVAVEEIWASDVWVLCTDGSVGQLEVSELTRLAEREDVLQVPIILVIVSERHLADSANLSIGIAFYACAQEAAILYKNASSGRISVINAKGRFAPLLDRTKDTHSRPSFHDENEFKDYCEKMAISVEKSHGRQGKAAISLGVEWDTTINVRVNVNMLLQQGHVADEDLVNLLKEEALNQLALVCKTRGQLGTLREFLLRHKQQELIIRLEDRHGATAIMEQMVTTAPGTEERTKLANALREAHEANRKTYISLINEPNEEARLTKKRNRMIDRALSVIADFEKSGYTADILDRKSNRARRAGVVSATEAEVHLAALDLADSVSACRAACSICCGDEEIMSIVLKKLDDVQENTTDFALNFPLAAGQAKQNADMISSQCVCFQCASLLPHSIHREKICSVLPALDYYGANKKYINHQLTQAITGGLATGVSGMIQIFTTILDRTLETKEWCSAQNSADSEVLARRKVFEWMLQNLLRNCSCRETFSEVGAWVEYPRALEWAANEYTDAGLDSWIIQYPLAGFNQLLRWYKILSTSVTPQQLSMIKKAKLIHLLVASIMSAMLKAQRTGLSWKNGFLTLIYQVENGPGVPRDIGPKSVLSPDGFWSRLGHVLGGWTDVVSFLETFDETSRVEVVLRLQLLIFWALFTQKGHTTPKSFFATIRSREEFGLAVLDPTRSVPEDAIRQILHSIFCPKLSTECFKAHPKNDVPPFVSPFGASVLRCGTPGCSVIFYHGETDKHGEVDTLTIRTRRANHLNEVHAVSDTNHSETGLPEATAAPTPPTSYSLTLHLSTAKVWSRLTMNERQEIGEAMRQGQDSAIARFVTKVRSEICTDSHRGNIYSPTIDDEVREVLPSFLEALRVASIREGCHDASGMSYVHDWTNNTVLWKAKYELSLLISLTQQ